MTMLDRRVVFAIALLALGTMPATAARNNDKNIGWPGETLIGAECRGLSQGFGPFDYTDPMFTVAGNYTRHGSAAESPLRFVEKAHFTQIVERLIRGKQAKNPMVDIDYTLRAFPNHHRALYSMTNDYLRKIPAEHRDDDPKKYGPYIDGFPPPECYFQRAAYFAPEDGMVRMLFGLYLHRRGVLDEALAEYQQAEKLMPSYAELYYNMGLLQFERGEYAEAREYADKAYGLNYQLPGLRRKLEALNR